ncbi:MAG TPA: hypothetical protein VMC03_20680 [Streptosporangiaceae bacterium]|nr:hypothetical protein [Streptosporangiaceae bacterium]
MAGVIGRAVGSACGGADTGGRGVLRLVEDPGEQGSVGGPLLQSLIIVLLGLAAGAHYAGGGLGLVVLLAASVLAAMVFSALSNTIGMLARTGAGRWPRAAACWPWPWRSPPCPC